MIYKICGTAEWAQAQTVGCYDGSPVDRRDGYVHFSTAAQLPETARRHFHGQHELVLVTVDDGRLGGFLKWEPSRGGDLFPHLYGTLPLSAVVAVTPIATRDDGTLILPAL